MVTPQAHPGRHRWRWAVVVVISLVAGAAVAWAVITVFRPPTEAIDDTSFTYVEVSPGEVGSSVTLNASAEWTPDATADNAASGVVTSVDVDAGAMVHAGDALFSVDLRPVSIAEGHVPSFRALARGVSGQDVKQFQTLLADLGLYSGAIDGTFAASTEQAAKAWQRSNGVSADGVVQPGDLIFVDTLPVRVALDPTLLTRGARLAGGEPVLLQLPTSPVFDLSVTAAQAATIPDGARVSMTSPSGGTWVAETADRTSDQETNSVTIALVEAADGPICAEHCGEVPPVGQTLLLSQVVTVPTVSGSVVPTAALRSLADGTVVVIDGKGKQRTVEVVESARGMSVIEGVEVGTRVRIPAGDE
ncbi:peptidoglycan-binding domain-containing protein [Galbitalea sp. SE-J8]|uniref:peptidoglycan-binding domain-containing protein n=1 Tax=Galbitalea sp. SE-J8 TaxID=3054952 RepID=UPI00259CA6E1|nr:peptidoglycan-binding domain-containing protein [Galbitalea sp. SE-J8]MDM4764141.1 peptidoglycan-binding domain-containing protein [Galbitalea sp. SE-J8]